MTREDVLNAAKACVSGDREQDYGSPEDNFRRIADFWTVYIRGKCVSSGADVCVNPVDVAAMMTLLKIARAESGHSKADNWIDVAGYAACAGELDG